MKMYLSIQAGIQVGDYACEAHRIADQHGCLLAQRGNGTANETVGIGKSFNATGESEADFYAMALIDVFDKD
jgi:hypothetical protein